MLRIDLKVLISASHEIDGIFDTFSFEESFSTNGFEKNYRM